MTTNPEWRPRLSVDISEDLYRRIQKAFPWGVRNSAMIALIEQVVEAIEKEGEIVAYLIANKKLRIFGDKNEIAESSLFNKP